MKQKNFKKQILILGGVIVLLLVVLIFQSRDKMHYRIPEMGNIAQDQVTKIDIVKADGHVLLQKEKEGWSIGSERYPADSKAIETVLKAAAQLVLTDMASETKNYTIYGLDQKMAITVNVFKGNDVLRTFWIGNAASTHSHTFVRLKEDAKVYMARGNFRRDFEKDVADFRDKVVMKFDKEEIQEITVTKGKETFHAVKKVQTQPVEKKAEGEEQAPPEDIVQWEMADNQPANKDEVDSLLNQLRNISCAGYMEGKTKEDMANPIYRVVLKGTKEYSIEIFEKTGEEDKKYPAVSSENKYPFLFSSYSGENIMKKIEDLKNKKE